jgi:DNA-binding NtrC family response regulator
MLIRLGIAIRKSGLSAHLARKLMKSDTRVELFEPPNKAWQKLLRSGCDLIVISSELLLEPIDSGISILNELPENPTTIIIHPDDSAEANARLAAAGADVVLYAGISKKSMIEAIETSIDLRRQFIQGKRLHRTGLTDPRITDFISESLAMQIFMDEVQQVIASDSPILLMGETGVGKEHLAKAIHAASPLSAGPFISVNAAAMPEPLLESELFGHEQGAFTGAVRYRRGAFELAHRGTIFLDEIGDMPLHLQSKLLRVLQDYEVKPIGGETPIELDVRVIAATNRNLEEEFAAGNFRQDLYYRLSVLALTIPPLRSRREDIPAMARKFVALYRHRIGREIKGLSDNVLEALSRYDWPGNVRELMNVIERAILLTKTNEITMKELPLVFHDGARQPKSDLTHLMVDRSQWVEKTLPEVKQELLDQLERLYLETVLTYTSGRIDRTARIAGIHPRGLYSKMKRHNLRKEDYRKKTDNIY